MLVFPRWVCSTSFMSFSLCSNLDPSYYHHTQARTTCDVLGGGLAVWYALPLGSAHRSTQPWFRSMLKRRFAIWHALPLGSAHATRCYSIVPILRPTFGALIYLSRAADSEFRFVGMRHFYAATCRRWRGGAGHFRFCPTGP